MKSPSKNRGAASVLVVVVIVIVGWTIGMFMQNRPSNKDSDSSPKKEVPVQGDDQKKTTRTAHRSPDFPAVIFSKERLSRTRHGSQLGGAKAKQEGIDALLKIHASDSALVADLGVHYRSKDLQYTEVGVKRRYSRIEGVQGFSSRLFTAIRPFAVKNLKAHHGKATAVL